MARADYRAEVASYAGQMRGEPGEVAAPAGADEVDAGTAPKLAPESVNYRPANCCEVCHFFIGSEVEDAGTCQIVSGAIDGDWICNYYQSRNSGGRPATFSVLVR